MSVLPVRGSGSGLDTRYSAVQAAFFFDDLTQASMNATPSATTSFPIT